MRFPRLTIWRMMAAVMVIAVALAFFRWVNDDLISERKDASERMACANHLRQIALALASYENIEGTFPPGTVFSAELPPMKRLSFFVMIAPYLCDQRSGLLFEKDLPWDDQKNRLPIIRPSPIESPASTTTTFFPPCFSFLECPKNSSRIDPGKLGPIDYIGIAGIGVDSPKLLTTHPRAGVFGYDRHTRMVDIKDGVSSTMMVMETAIDNGPWTAGGPATIRGLDPNRQPYIGVSRQFGGIHNGGAMVVFADGSVHCIRSTIDPKIFEALSTIAGSEKCE